MSAATTELTRVNGAVALDDAFTLSDLDMIMPDALVSIFSVYELQADTQTHPIVESMRQGLKQAVKQQPVLAANIHFDASKKPLKQMSAGSVDLQVRSFACGEYKSYRQLAESSFSPRDFDQRQLLPSPASTNASVKPMTVVQLNFISGGVILALGFNHVPTDLKAMDLAITLICGCAKASMDGRSMPSCLFDFQRHLFAAPLELSHDSREQLLLRTNDYRIVDTAVVQNGISSAKKVDAPIRGKMYRLENTAAQQLKESCAPLRDVAYVSTYDCISGLFWSSVLRVRAASQPHLKKCESRLIHPVDLRNRPAEDVPEQYFGNAGVVASAGPVQVEKLIGSQGLCVAASHIRQSILKSDVHSMDALATLGTMMSPKEKLLYAPVGLVDKDCLVSAWNSIDSRSWDFGIGPPSAIRTWDLPMVGGAILFPDCQPKHGSKSYDLFVVLYEHEQEELSKDEIFCRWFHSL